LPEVRKIHLTEESSWKYLLKDLEEEGRCAGDLMAQIRTVQSDYPDIAALLQRISEDEKKHCDKIREQPTRRSESSNGESLWGQRRRSEIDRDAEGHRRGGHAVPHREGRERRKCDGISKVSGDKPEGVENAGGDTGDGGPKSPVGHCGLRSG
jgi:hypothetical protein